MSTSNVTFLLRSSLGQSFPTTNAGAETRLSFPAKQSLQNFNVYSFFTGCNQEILYKRLSLSSRDGDGRYLKASGKTEGIDEGKESRCI